ncbi:hypothetical protein Pcac1_g24687 [Phytophthora cactorum]|nr:hypothetical protein Pcac1_g24687 [Phytophthora cactorum]
MWATTRAVTAYDISVALGRFIVTDDIDPVISRVDKHGLRQAMAEVGPRGQAVACVVRLCVCDRVVGVLL